MHLVLTVVAAVLAVLLSSAGTAAQERKVPGDSERISIPGCARGRVFIVGEGPEHEPVRADVQPGRRFRLNGPKKILEEIKARERSMIEVTGLVRKGQLAGPGGVSIAGGRVRIGGDQPRVGLGDARRESLFTEVVIDVESWRALPAECPAR